MISDMKLDQLKAYLRSLRRQRRKRRIDAKWPRAVKFYSEKYGKEIVRYTDRGIAQYEVDAMDEMINEVEAEIEKRTSKQERVGVAM